MLELLWWVVFVAALGATLGSFGNVLIHRIPRGPILKPVWSFCPSCEARIRAVDNIPLLSFLRLGGRCRNCGCVISARYPLIEAATIIAFIVVLDGLAIAAARPDLADPQAFGVSDRLLEAWPMLVAHLVLVAGLVVISVIDLEEYWVDLRLLWVIFVVGLAAHLAWRPTHDGAWQPPDATAGAMALAACVGLMISQAFVWLIGGTHVEDRFDWDTGDQPSEGEDTPSVAKDGGADVVPADARTDEVAYFAAGESLSDSKPAATPVGEIIADADAPLTDLSAAELADAPMEPVPTTPVFPESDDELTELDPPPEKPPRPQMLTAFLVALITLACLAAVVAGALGAHENLSFGWRAAGIIGVLFLFLVIGNARRRESDEIVAEAIESERFSARRMALEELFYLLPPLAFAALAWWAARHGFWGAVDWPAVYHSWPTSGWPVLAQASRCLVGALVAGGIGWGVRIFFTMLLGKEAFGLGDVYIMAAAGAVAGWAVVVLGFFFASLFALAGVILLLLVKRSRAIPFGPWLSLGILATILSAKVCLAYFENGIEGLRYVMSGGGR